MKLDIIRAKPRQKSTCHYGANKPDYDIPKITETGFLMIRVKWYSMMNQKFILVQVTISEKAIQ